MRKTMIELVVSTDMKQHLSITAHFNTMHHLGELVCVCVYGGGGGSN